MNQGKRIQLNEFTVLDYTPTKSIDGGYFTVATTDTSENIDISIDGMKKVKEFLDQFDFST